MKFLRSLFGPRGSIEDQLIEAVENLNLEKLRKVIAKGADVNAKYSMSETPLITACRLERSEKAGEGDRLRVVKELLANGANVNARNYFGDTPLICACGLRKTSEGERLLLVKELIAAGTDVNAKNESQSTPLFYASSVGVVRELLKNGAEIDSKDNLGRSALMAICHLSSERSIQIMKELIARGADVNARNNVGDTPLMIASEHANSVVVGYQIERGADVNAKGNHDCTAMHAIFCWHTTYRETPAWHRTGQERAAIIRTLIGAGANVNAKDKAGHTPLMAACRLMSAGGTEYSVAECDIIDAVKALINGVCDVNAKDNDGWTALMEASKQGNNQIVKVLLDNGADFNAKASDGTTAMIAAGFWHETVDLLVKAGCPRPHF